MKYISTEYCQGIKDGRSYLERFQPGVVQIREIISNLLSTMKGFGPGPVKDIMKGERDFWQLQLKKNLSVTTGKH